VKTISMSTFSPAEVDALTEGGNKRARKYWLATFEEGRSYPIDQEDPANIDRFMQLCYVDKKWAKPIGATSPAGRDDDEDSVSRNERKKKKADKEKSLKRQATSDRAFTVSAWTFSQDRGFFDGQRSKARVCERSRMLIVPFGLVACPPCFCAFVPCRRRPSLLRLL